MIGILTKIGTWAISLATLGVGFWLVIWAVIDIGGALGGKTKEWGKLLIGLAVGIIGGFLMVFGGNKLLALFKSNGQDIPL